MTIFFKISPVEMILLLQTKQWRTEKNSSIVTFVMLTPTFVKNIHQIRHKSKLRIY